MKIGILTFQGSINYGATLQTYALQKYIQNQGHDCEIIRLNRSQFPSYIPSKRYLPFCTEKEKTSILGTLLKWLKGNKTKQNKPKQPVKNEFKQKLTSFSNCMRMTRPYYCIDDLYDNPPQYDLYITGSDQVWNPYRGDCVEPYFLTFAPKEAKCISYAASLGVCKIDEKVKKAYREWLRHYTAISVREKVGQQIVQELTDKHVERVLDPTFLLTKEEWLSLATEPTFKQPYILLFTLQYSLELLTYGKKLSQESGIQLLYLTQRQPAAPDDSYIAIDTAGIEDFIGLINHAELMITNSFHGTVMALQTNCKNVFTYLTNLKRGSRITDMYELFGIRDHVLQASLSENFAQLKGRQFERKEVNSTIQLEADKSRQFLLNYL